MKKIILIWLFSASYMAEAQVTNVSFDGVKGEYIIQYINEQDSLKTGFYVPGNQVIPIVKSSAQCNPLCKYNYSITNSSQALHPLYYFGIKVSAKITDIVNPNSDWWGRYIFSAGTVKWNKVEGEVPGIEPGFSADKFAFKSNGLPEITTGIAKGITDIYFPDERYELPYPVELVIDSLRSLSKGVTINTIGPASNPTNLNSEALLENLNLYLSRSCEELGWITNRGICNSLKVKLDQLREHLENEKPRQAANVLQAFLNEVEAQKDKALSSEAYALLYYNGEYLLQKLEAEQ